MSARLDLFIHGTVFLDLVLSGLDNPPAPGTEVFTTDMVTCPGGIANLAVAGRRLGLSTSLSAAFGDDPYGDVCWHTLGEQEGVDLTRSRRIAGWPTPLTVSLAYSGDRSMVTHMRSTPVAEDEFVGTPPRAQAALAYLGPEPREWHKHAQRQGTRIVADVGWDATGRWSRGVLDQLAGCYAFLPNEVEAMAYTRTRDAQTALHRLADLVPVAAVTSGPAGSCAVDNLTGEQALVPAVPVPARDTTGAGDVFDVSFTLGCLRGWPLGDRLAFANLCSALSVRRLGGSVAAPGWGDIDDWWTEVRSRARYGNLAWTELLARYAFLDEIVPQE